MRKTSSKEPEPEQEEALYRFGDHYEVLVHIADDGLLAVIEAAIRSGGIIISVEAT